MGVWDGLDECEISRPEILFQSAPARGYDIQRVSVLNKAVSMHYRGRDSIYHGLSCSKVQQLPRSKMTGVFTPPGEQNGLSVLPIVSITSQTVVEP